MPAANQPIPTDTKPSNNPLTGKTTTITYSAPGLWTAPASASGCSGTFPNYGNCGYTWTRTYNKKTVVKKSNGREDVTNRPEIQYFTNTYSCMGGSGADELVVAACHAPKDAVEIKPEIFEAVASQIAEALAGGASLSSY